MRIIERHTEVGGAAVTEEFHPGFRNSVASYTVSLLHPKVTADLKLAEHGLRIIERPLSNFLPLPGNQYLQIARTLGETQAEMARFFIKQVGVKRREAAAGAITLIERFGSAEHPPACSGARWRLLQQRRGRAGVLQSLRRCVFYLSCGDGLRRSRGLSDPASTPPS